MNTGTWSQTVLIKDFSLQDIIVVPNHINKLWDPAEKYMGVNISGEMRYGLGIYQTGGGSTTPFIFLEDTTTQFDLYRFKTVAVGNSMTGYYLESKSNTTAQRSFGINNTIAGFGATTDAIIEVTGLTGTLGLNNFTTTLV